MVEILTSYPQTCALTRILRRLNDNTATDGQSLDEQIDHGTRACSLRLAAVTARRRQPGGRRGSVEGQPRVPPRRETRVAE